MVTIGDKRILTAATTIIAAHLVVPPSCAFTTFSTTSHLSFPSSCTTTRRRTVQDSIITRRNAATVYTNNPFPQPEGKNHNDGIVQQDQPSSSDSNSSAFDNFKSIDTSTNTTTHVVSSKSQTSLFRNENNNNASSTVGSSGLLSHHQKRRKVLSKKIQQHRKELNKSQKKKKPSSSSSSVGVHLPQWFRQLLIKSTFKSIFKGFSKSSSTTEVPTELISHEQDAIDTSPPPPIFDVVGGMVVPQPPPPDLATEGNSTSITDEKDMTHKHQYPRLPGSRALRLLLSRPLVEFKLSILVFLSSVFVSAGTIASIPTWGHAIMDLGEDCIAFLFVVEYLLRWYCNGFFYNIQHVFKPMVIVDFLSFLPLVIKCTSNIVGYSGSLPFGSVVIGKNLIVNLRLLRLLKLQRHIMDVQTFEKFQQAVGIYFFGRDTKIRRYHLQLARVLLSIFTLLTVSAGLIYAAENVVNPAICDIPTAFYFVITTVTTVGFGDITPVTSIGRMIVCAMILAGAAIIPLQLSQFVDALLDFRRDLMETERIKKKKQELSKQLSQSQQQQQQRIVDADESQIAYELEDVIQPDGTIRKEKTYNILECPVCRALPHREMASFCWSCGSPLKGGAGKGAAVTNSHYLPPC